MRGLRRKMFVCKSVNKGFGWNDDGEEMGYRVGGNSCRCNERWGRRLKGTVVMFKC